MIYYNLPYIKLIVAFFTDNKNAIKINNLIVAR